ncbi:UDP-N-acetylmuramoyl-tripeptide--D-alanyl-D-alanine ligase [Candidatus Hakubella thermalkaliphila]|uniref:UDP-N-acetylmuramoyl-tripeptide--D-alanyl-D-alanine ligase n=9 Tax=Candidatus Hakubella thermalkaliphila TaxID=2754717 RepID=A0A6V8PD06_9ACTN|nr:UDP-N-acetylmuramoyl-tripeptide--D-alanyl-D-alanine ligase [Candidatus Hakubella thermalkaliphila]GFP22939.1 UDP-N-acetylmuramoyl-tripeptide--D-alanyl-D-alanine ligase [Candidatus Hakubella thermalkaliphila]GFP30178.1 UDP-N-acetylmuramoyl-tripeptide--D-alanyl-D-alanine ligase [Candidatus Hakubella thermalkaliphila]GFP39042.1 UDP-N-acetylmuramoyl-tripeptide--D-alanyl-D-alanine ligase [Candidatus Hakubella thermalkaliphila]GFP42701.1 UDP-N-acetylmuramoyl-tripeptide--D-alanyl-D-alanine ligase [
MIPIKLEDLARITEGRVLRGDLSQLILSISTDSRTLQPGDLYVSLRGERFDGHDFIWEAVSRGAMGFLTSRSYAELSSGQKGVPGDESAAQSNISSTRSQKGDLAIIQVRDCLAALQALAREVRNRSSYRTIGLTGSTGKTSTKDFLKSILAKRFKVWATPKSYNNEVGLPLTILGADSQDEILIAELGMRGEGQIAQLCEILRPDMGIVTRIGPVHLETLGSEDRIARAEGELVEAIPETGLVVLNRDDRWFPSMADKARGRVVSYGMDSEAEVRATDIKLDAEARPSFQLVSGDRRTLVKLQVMGEHNVANALAAAALADELGVSMEEIKGGLQGAQLSDMRMEMVRVDGIRIINDAYNANPMSMKAALKTLSHMGKRARTIALLGDMLELGEKTVYYHREIGREVVEQKIDFLIAMGELSKYIYEAALEAGLEQKRALLVDSLEDAAKEIKKILSSGDVLLIKASRAIGLERVLERIA